MHVINYELPRDINSYVHRIGRTGRMGRQGQATSLFSPANKPVARELVQLLQENSQVVPDWLQVAAESSGSGGRGYSGRGKFGGRDYRANAQVRQYRHSGGNNYPGAPGGYGGGQGGGGWGQQGGYMAGMQHGKPNMYGGVGGAPGGDGNGWGGGWGQMGMPGMQQQQMPGGYQQQMSQSNGQRGSNAAPGWMGMPGAQASYAQYYGQQGGQGGQEGNGAAMMPMGMMWPRQQQMPSQPAQDGGHFSAQPPQDGQYSGQQPYQMQPIPN